MLKRLTTFSPAFFTPDGDRLNGRTYLLLILLCMVFFLPGLATLPPTDRDESLFAQTSKQMIETGNYIDIHYKDQLRYKKPVGIYWLQALSVKLLSPHHIDAIWAYRVPSIIGATVAVLMTASLGTLLFGPMTGLLAAIMMAGCLILNIEARLAKTDAALLGSVMVAQYALARAYMGYRSAKIGYGIFFAFWTAIAVGILLKGPIILLMVASTLVWLRLSEKNLKWFMALKPLAGIPYALLLVAPWFAAIAMHHEGGVFAQSAEHDLFGKIWQSRDRSFMPAGVYLLAFPFSFFPFSLWAILSIPDSWKKRREPGVRFCLGWIIPSWVVFELAFTKLPHYIMPLYPAIAMLAAKALLDDYPSLKANKRLRWLPPVTAGLWLLAGTILLICAVGLPYIMDQTWNRGVIATAFLMLIALGVSLMIFTKQLENSVIVMTAASLVFVTNLFVGVLPYLQHMWVSREIVHTAESIKPCPGPVQLASTYNEPSLVFLAGTQTFLDNDGRVLAHALQDNPCRIGVINARTEPRFLAVFASSSIKPTAVANVDGLDAGRNLKDRLTLYLLPTPNKP